MCPECNEQKMMYCVTSASSEHNYTFVLLAAVVLSSSYDEYYFKSMIAETALVAVL